MGLMPEDFILLFMSFFTIRMLYEHFFTMSAQASLAVCQKEGW